MRERRTRQLEQYIRDEIVEAGERGCDPGEVAEASRHFEDLKRKADPDRWRHYESILDILGNLEAGGDFPYEEPSTLDEIRSSAGGGISLPTLSLSNDELKDRILGAWLGRCAGCMLGKPVEGRKREYIRRLLESGGSYPLDGFFPEVENLPSGCEDHNPDKGLLRGQVTHVVRDDDIDYTILNLHIVKEHGLDFTSEHISEEWLKRMPYGMVYSAETAAYANFVNGIMPPESASFRNPYREWIGAQIRADLWGYISPGMPERAAELAFRDASVSHVANGIYGEMFFAAAVSAAFATDDIEEIIGAGLGVVPVKSRFAQMVNDVIGWRRQHETWESAFDAVIGKYGKYAVCHTLNNAAIVLLALLHGEGDYGKTVAIAVMCGEDTDCNGATAGSIMGAVLGARRFPKKWSECLNDEIESAVIGYSNSVISALADETSEIARSHKG